jgi:predicted nucleic-acid-binding protein
MIALDTNVVLRILVTDNPAQSAKARDLLSRETVSISATVLLETAWVLRSGYQFPAAEIARFLRALLGLPQMNVAEPALVAEALRCYEAGMDFADALHLAFAGEAARFATFDKRFAAKATRLKTRPVLSL